MLSLVLIACHMVGDFVVQTQWMADEKLKDWQVRAAHVTAYCLCFIPPLVVYVRPGETAASRFLILLWITHFITDSRRWASGEKWPPKPILVDQAIHLATLAVLGVVFLER